MKHPALLPALDVAAATLAGLLVYRSFATGAGASLWFCAPLGLILLLWAARRHGTRFGLLLTAVFAVAFFGPLLRWVGSLLGWFPQTMLIALESVFLLPLALLGPVLRDRRRWVRLAGPAGLWTACEFARSHLPFGGFAWGRLGFGQVDGPFLGLAPLGGAALAGAAVVTCAALVVEAFGSVPALAPRRPVTGRLVPVAAALALALVGMLVPLPTAAQAGTLSVAAVQGNVPTAGLEFNAQRRAVLDNHAAVTRNLAQRARAEGRRPDVVIWPENSSDIDPLLNPDAAQVIADAVRDVNAPVLVGAVLDVPDGTTNTGLLYEPGGGVIQTYTKRHPVPFAEYVPHRAFFRRISSMVDMAGHFVPGDRVGIFQVSGRRFGDLICFEVIEDDLVRDTVAAGGDLLAVQTNNATFGFSEESAQQLQVSRFRAAEQSRAVAHVSTVGISAMIRPDGSLLSSTELFTPAALAEDLPLRTTRTPSFWLARPLEWLGTALGLGVALMVLRRRREPADGSGAPAS